MGNPLQLILVFSPQIAEEHSVDTCSFLFQKSSLSLGDGPHDIGLPGCLFYRIPHKVCVPLKKATAAQSVKSLATQSRCGSVSKVFGSSKLLWLSSFWPLKLKAAVAQSVKSLAAQSCCGSAVFGSSKLLWLSSFWQLKAAVAQQFLADQSCCGSAKVLAGQSCCGSVNKVQQLKAVMVQSVKSLPS